MTVKCPKCGHEFELPIEEKPSEVTTETTQPKETEKQEVAQSAWYKKIIMPKSGKFIVKEKIFCPICGSSCIRPRVDRKFRCLNCKALFSRPKKTKIKLRERPRYIG